MRKIFVVNIIILLLMSNSSFAQELPAFDEYLTNAGKIELHFIGHGSLMMKTDKYVIHIDPVSTSGSYANLPKADLILVTHEHGDHLDADLIGKLKKENTVMLANQNSAAKVAWAKAMKAGDKYQFNDISVEAVPAYNIVNMRAPGQPFHPSGTGNGYILTIGGKRIYVAGDSENTPEMKALKDIDVAFLPMNLPYTMTPVMVADAAMAFRPKILYPYHMSDTNPEELIKLLSKTNIEVRIRNLK